MKFLYALSFVFLMSAGINAQDLDSNLRIHYAFNGNAEDISGNNLHGTLMNGPVFTTSADGTAETALEFDGIDDWLEIPNPGELFNTSWTFSVYFKLDQVPFGTQVDDFFFLTSAQLGLNDFYMYIDNSTSRVTVGFSDTVNFDKLVGTTTIAPDAWTHVAITYNHDLLETSIYLNGQLEIASTAYKFSTQLKGLRLNLFNQANEGAFGDFGDGIVDELRLYRDRFLTQEEVLALYQLDTDFTNTTDDLYASIAPSVFPNPSNGQFTIDMGTHFEDTKIRIFDVVGNEIFNNTYSSKIIAINAATIPTGIYAISIETQAQTFSQKIVVEK